MEINDATVFAIFREQWFDVLKLRINIAQVESLGRYRVAFVHVHHDAMTFFVSRRVLQQLNPDVLILGNVKREL